MTMFLYTFTEREKIYNLIEFLTGARFTTSFTRVGGQTRDLPPGFLEGVREFVDQFDEKLVEFGKMLNRNRIFVDRTKDLGVIPADVALDFGLTGPNLRGAGND
jgi:NADH-quinone oxidoreductase subunit D